jgi:valyl-tRNA synthetase
VHRAEWPTPTSGTTNSNDTSNADFFLETVGSVLAEIRRSKTEAKISQRAAVSLVVIAADSARAGVVTQALVDLSNAGNVAEFSIVDGDNLSVSVTLAPDS